MNGKLKSENESLFKRITAYAEQRDMHMPLATVRESLLFSATLRLPATVTDQQRADFVEELLDILELRHLADRIVGSEKYAGLSPGQLKLLTIGVELASNPSILFLDEPTSGLDSRAAVVVMRVVAKIAATGRSVLCTSQSLLLHPRQEKRLPCFFSPAVHADFSPSAFSFAFCFSSLFQSTSRLPTCFSISTLCCCCAREDALSTSESSVCEKRSARHTGACLCSAG